MIGPATVECPHWMLQQARGGRNASPSAGSGPVRTGIVNAVNAVALESARDAADAGIIDPVLIGNRDAIVRTADEIGWSIGGFEIIAADGEQAAAEAGARAAGAGDLGAVMKGHLHTDVFMRAVLNRDAGLRMGKPLTHVFHLTVPGRAGSLILTDCALNPAPDVEAKKALIGNAVTLAKATGIARPNVALLSATEVPSPHIPSTGEAVELTEWARTHQPDAHVAGPLAFDLAVSAESARIKGIDGPVAGHADIVVVPEIVSGNALYKGLVHFAGACAAGVVMGAKVPVLLTSRADPPAARLASAALAGIVAHATSREG
ncbi:MAG: bifunctional enoyl-CoA hydratase/phosphate acetyltransferase [Pseudomonadota bacterium]